MSKAQGEHSREASGGDFDLILGNSNRRFSGVTSTMLRVLDVQKRLVRPVVLGKHHLPPDVRAVSFLELARACRSPLPDGSRRVFHARRNDEMIQALILRDVLGARIRVVFTSTAQRPKTWLTRSLMRRMDGLLSTCTAAAGFMDPPPDRIIAHGVDPELYRPAQDRAAAWKELGLPGTHGIGIFGRVRAQKGVDLLIDAALEVLPDDPHFTVVVVGEIEGRGLVAELTSRLEAAGLADRVVFTGELPFERLPGVFRAMSIVTALSRNEGFGLTVLEAMASGVPVIATRAGAWPDIIDDGVDGYLIPVDDRRALVRHLRSLMGDEDLRAGLGDRARQKVLGGYTVEREARALIEYFRGLR